jgi:hypothetical protein
MRWPAFLTLLFISQSLLLTPASHNIFPMPFRASMRVRRSESSPTSDAPEQAKKAFFLFLLFNPTNISHRIQVHIFPITPRPLLYMFSFYSAVSVFYTKNSM